MGAVLGAVPCVVERLRGHRVFSAWGGPVPLPGSCRAAWKWQVEPMLNGVSHMDRQVLPLRWMLAGAKRYARKRRVYTRDHDTITGTWPCKLDLDARVDSPYRKT